MSDIIDSMKYMRALFEISAIMEDDGCTPDAFTRALDIVRTVVGCHAASLFIYDRETGSLVEAASVGRRVELIEGIPFDMGTGFSAWVAKERRSVLLPELRGARPDGCRSFISTPLVARDELIGVMNLGHEEPNGLTAEHAGFLDIIVAQFARVVERAEYERRILKTNEELRAAREEMERQQQTIIEMERVRAVCQMTVSINHEINNLLTTVIGNIELILITRPDLDDAVKSKLSTALSEAHKIAGIVEKLRKIKRVVIGNYLGEHGEQMVDLESSSIKEENRS